MNYETTDSNRQPITLDPDYDIAPLVLAVIAEARRAAERGNTDALDWLACDGVAWCDAIGTDTNVITRWVIRKRRELGKRQPERPRLPRSAIVRDLQSRADP